LRIVANVPRDLLEEAMNATGKGITDTLVVGLRHICRAQAYHKATALRGKLKLKIDLNSSRERSS